MRTRLSFNLACLELGICKLCQHNLQYQIGHPDAFRGSFWSIDDKYAEGVSVTHGFPRQHIWTFAAGYDEQDTGLSCPCVAGSTNGNNIPSFVGQNYFCETGITQLPGFFNTFWPNGDPLWDGQGCGPTSSCCSFNSPPWFNVRLSNPTTDYIEVRICGSGTDLEDVPIQLMELYVKWTKHAWMWQTDVVILYFIEHLCNVAVLYYICCCAFAVLFVLYTRLLTVQCSQLVASFPDSFTWEHWHYSEDRKSPVSFLMWTRRNRKRVWIFRTKKHTAQPEVFAILRSQVLHMQFTHMYFSSWGTKFPTCDRSYLFLQMSNSKKSFRCGTWKSSKSDIPDIP